MAYQSMEHPFFALAPMEGVSDLPFRLWMSSVSSPYLCSTPFLRVTETFPKKAIPRSYAPELNELKQFVNYQLRPQIMASKTEDFLRIAPHILDQTDSIDLNCGCPSPNAVGSKAGSSLLTDSKTFSSFVKTIADDLGSNRLSVKMRTGFKRHNEFDSLIASIQDIPLKHLGIHGRTREQKYDGLNRWTTIFKAAEFLPFPVIGSGDIVSFESVAALDNRLQILDSILIGRGALRNPWLFLEIESKKPIKISVKTLCYSLACLGILYHLFLRNENELFDFVKSGYFLKTYHNCEESWGRLYSALSECAFNKAMPIEELEVPPFVLGRVKMIWNYLRSSLPERYFEPQILRSRSLQTLLSRIMDVGDRGLLTVTHQPKFDWVYTSRKKNPFEIDHLYL